MRPAGGGAFVSVPSQIRWRSAGGDRPSDSRRIATIGTTAAFLVGRILALRPGAACCWRGAHGFSAYGDLNPSFSPVSRFHDWHWRSGCVRVGHLVAEWEK